MSEDTVSRSKFEIALSMDRTKVLLDGYRAITDTYVSINPPEDAVELIDSYRRLGDAFEQVFINEGKLAGKLSN